MNKLEKYEKLRDERLITLRPNVDGDLLIANYTPAVQYDKLWTEDVKQCRGLILDLEGNVVARPFPKFFNLEEHTPEELPKEAFDVYDKLDGSLGILFNHKGKWSIATRGSFTSEQAIKANSLLSKYKLRGLVEGFTYLVEIIYPSNRIVCNYGDKEELVLLAVVNNETGEEIPYPNLKLVGLSMRCEVVKRYDGIKDLAELRKLEDTEREGFVIQFKSGMRVKMKFSEYVRLHRIITQVNSKTIWEYLSTGQSFDELIERVPDEFFNFIKEISLKIKRDYEEIEKECKRVFKKLETRASTAEYFKKQTYPGILFAMYDKKDYSKQIWTLVKP